ncbi:MAG: TraI/MobA(P) family conjugative relaxase [Pseudomonadota bacterium]
MIAKHVPMNFAQKSNFAGLVKYLTGPQGKSERVGVVRVTNCQTQQAEMGILEVINTQVQNTRSKADKTYHLIVSFRVGEMPDDETLKVIEDRLCTGLGFDGHQRISVIHHDTDNLHMHIAVNKIHPTHYTIHEPFNAYRTLAQLCDKLENELGLEKDNHKARKVRSENLATDMEQHAAVESLLGWIKRECNDQIQGAQSWTVLHQVMREHGLKIHERANGLVITSENGVSVKASSVAREFSKARLEGRLGSFESSTEPTQSIDSGKRYAKHPVRTRIDTVELHARYLATQKLATSLRATEWAKAIGHKNRSIESAKRDARLKRAAIKLTGAPGIGKKLMYAATSKALRDEIAVINQHYRKERQDIYEKYQRHAWADWLRNEAMSGDHEALATLRAREVATGLSGNTIGGQNSANGMPVGTKHDSITKKGTVIYRVGASVVRDDGDKLIVSRGANQASFEAMLRMAIERYGSRITVNGSAAFKKKVVHAAASANLSVSFDDNVLERRRQQVIQAVKTKEKKHGLNTSNNSVTLSRRPGRSCYGGGKQAAASRAAASDHGTASFAHGHRVTNSYKPNTRSARQNPPPEARHGLRGMSEFGVVHVPKGREVLLPGDVLGHVEHQRTQPNHGVRRDIHRPGRITKDGRSAADRVSEGAPMMASHGATQSNDAGQTCKPNVHRIGSAPPPASKDRLRLLTQLGAIKIGEDSDQTQATFTMPAATPPPKADIVSKPGISRSENRSIGQIAADKYITEREQKRLNGFDIKKHSRYSFHKDASAAHAGTRQIDGQALALLDMGKEIMVLPVDDATARRLKRVAIGQTLSLTANGAIKTKGRSR